MEELTKKQAGFVKDYLLTGNGTQAALKNYDIQGQKPEKIASVIATENLDKPSIKNAILSMRERFTEEFLEEAHKKLFKQKQLDYFVFPKKLTEEEIRGHVEAAGLKLIVIRQSEKGQMAFYSIDNALAIAKALDMSYKLVGLYAPEKRENVNVNIEAKSDDPELVKLREQFDARIKDKIVNDIHLNN